MLKSLGCGIGWIFKIHFLKKNEPNRGIEFGQRNSTFQFPRIFNQTPPYRFSGKQEVNVPKDPRAFC